MSRRAKRKPRKPRRSRVTSRTLGFASYIEYLASDHWQDVRHHFLTRGKVCEICEKEYSLQVHHRNYRWIGRELESEASKHSMQVLCHRCHEAIHKLRKTGLNNQSATYRLLKAQREAVGSPAI